MTPLALAVLLGQLDVSDLLVGAGAHLLCFAAANQCIAILRRLLGLADCRQLINARDFTGMTPLHHAVSRGSLDTVQLLLERGADPNLHAQPFSPYDDPRSNISNNIGSSSSSSSRDGPSLPWVDTALGYAVHPHNPAPPIKRFTMVRLLLRYGADPNQPHGPRGHYPLHEAAADGRMRCVVRAGDALMRGTTALMDAAALAERRIVQDLAAPGRPA